jgi:hypothetical protein
MGASVFVPLSAALIDEGEFLENLDIELADLQQVLAKYVAQHGEKALKAVAKLQIEIQLKVENVESDAYSVKTSIKSVQPKRPASVSMAIGGRDDDGKLALFVREMGSDESTPAQGKLFQTKGQIDDE